MSLNPVIAMLGRRLRLAVIGGGSGSFIGPIHRLAARMDDRYELVTGVLSSNPNKAEQAAVEMGFAADRQYGTVDEMLETEYYRKDGADVVAIMTPNDSHFSYSMAALEKGFDVICDKPMTNSLENAETVHKTVQKTGLIFCLTHNYTGYPMVRQAKAMIEAGQLGKVRLIQVEYVQGGNAVERPKGKREWKKDPQRGGPSLVMGDIGSHAHNLVRFMTGLEVAEVAAEVGHIVPERLVDDYAGALLRMDNGARGCYWVTQAAAGVENCLRIRVSGSQGSVEWMQEHPQVLDYKPLGAPAERRTPNGPGTLPLAARSSRIAAGHPEGFPAGFANIYSDASEAIAARRTEKQADPLAMFFPDSADGLAGVKFIEHLLMSSSKNGQWVDCEK